MIMVKEGSLATMLSDSENPSHTEWQHNQPKIRDAYATGIVTGMDFIKESAKQIAGILATADVEVDRTLLKDFFFVDLPELQNADQVAASPQPGVAAGDRTASSGPIPEPRKRAYVIERIDSGFRIKGVEDATTRLGTIQVETAYDVNKGNPFLKYDLNDFDMNKTLNVDPKKVGNLVKDKNKLTFTPSDRAFEVKVSGFDTNRQLIIKARKVASGNVMANNDTGNNQTEDDNDD